MKHTQEVLMLNMLFWSVSCLCGCRMETHVVLANNQVAACVQNGLLSVSSPLKLKNCCVVLTLPHTLDD